MTIRYSSQRHNIYINPHLLTFSHEMRHDHGNIYEAWSRKYVLDTFILRRFEIVIPTPVYRGSPVLENLTLYWFTWLQQHEGFVHNFGIFCMLVLEILWFCIKFLNSSLPTSRKQKLNLRKICSVTLVNIYTFSRYTRLILGLHPANERRRYFVTTSLIGWVQP